MVDYLSPTNAASWASFIPEDLSQTRDRNGNWDRIHTNWRYDMAKAIAIELGKRGLGVQECHLYGSVEKCEAGMISDTDILIGFRGSAEQLGGLEKLLTEIDREVTGAFNAKYGTSVESLISPKIMGIEDLHARRGDAAILNDPGQSSELALR